MATHFADRHGRTTGVRRTGKWLLLCVVALAAVAPVSAQDFLGQPPRARQLLKSARELYTKGEYDNADLLYRQAELSKDGLTPTERQDLADQMRQNATAIQARRDGLRLLQQAQDAWKAGNAVEAENALRLAQANQFLSANDKAQAAGLAQALGQLRTAPVDTDAKGDPRTLLPRAREALKRGDLNTAESLARQAEKSRSFMAPLAFWSDSPARVLDDVRAARARAPKSPEPRKDLVASEVPPGTFVLPPNKDSGVPVVTNYTPAESSDRAKVKSQARQLVLDGYKALNQSDLETARQLANQARDLKPDLEWWDTNPDKLLADIQRHISNQKAATGVGDARTVLRQARGLFLQQRYDEAERLAVQAETLPGNRWGLFEDSPRKLRDEITRARTQLDQERATKLTSEARLAFKRGKFAEARAMATEAKQLQGTSAPLWTWSDTPDAVLRDVARMDKNAPTAIAAAPLPPPSNPHLPPPPPDIAAVSNLVPNPTPAGKMSPELAAIPPPVTFESAQMKTQAKQRAVALLGEARGLEKQGHLAEARAKALEAEKVHSVWSAYEESPGTVLRDLDTRASARIRQLVDQASDSVLRNPGDAARFQRADAYLLTARRLAESFRQDTAPIDQKLHWLQQMIAQSPQSRQDPMVGAPVFQSAQHVQRPSGEEASEPSTRDGAQKLDQARRELKEGNTLLARKLAEDVFFVPSLKEEAKSVLRSIDAEEHGQTILTAQRNFTAGLEAFAQRDYRKAAGVLGSVDVRLLSNEQARRVAEVLEAPELRAAVRPTTPVAPAGGTTQVVAREGAGKASISDLVDPHLESIRELHMVQFDKYRSLKIGAEQKANELAKAGKEDQAIEHLQSYLVELRASGLEAGGQARLTASVDDRIQKLRTELAKREIEREQKAAAGTPHNENDYIAKKTKTQEKVAELIQRGSQRMKEGKYDEALAEATKANDLDPDNTAARTLQYMATMKRNKETYEKNQAKRGEQFLELLDPNPGATPTSKDPVAFDLAVTTRANGRKDISVQNLLGKTPAERVIERKLSQPISLNFHDQPLYRVLQDLQAISGINIVADKAALAEKNISLEQPLSLQIDNISLKSALNLLLKQVRLIYVIKHEVIEITTPDNNQGKQIVRPYAIADLVIPVEDKATSQVNSFEDALKRHINNGSGGVHYNAATPYSPPLGMPPGTPVSNSQGSQAAPQGWTKSGPGNTIEHLLINLITNTIAPDTWQSAGGEGRIQYFPLGHALVISQVQEVQEEVQALLNALRRLQDIQIAIEMRVVSVGEQFFEKIGLDFDVNIRTPHYRQENQLLNGNYAPNTQVNRNLGVNNVFTGLTPAGQLTPDLNFPIKNTSYDFSVPPFGGYPGAIGASGGLSLGLAFLSDIQVFMFLEAAQGDRRTHIMQAPKITVFNGQTANINVQDVMFFLTGVQIVQAGSQTFFVPQNNPFPIGVGMSVTPVVSADRRFVRINLTPQLSNLITPNIPLIPVQIPIPQLFDFTNGTGAISGQPVIFQMFFQQPAFTTININTTVNVPDGGTVLLGGIKTLAEGRNEFGPPILSKIPYLSRLFRNTAWGRDAQSIMILVTPRIIINEEIEQEVLGLIPPIPR